MDRTGQVIGEKYKLLRLLGEGGMGAVYEAQHSLIGRRCAVKFLHAECARQPEIAQRFMREAQAMGKVIEFPKAGGLHHLYVRRAA